MDYLLPTILGVIVIEASFYVFHRVIEKRRLFSGLVANFVLGLIVFNFSFGNAVLSIFEHITISGNNFTIFDIFLIFFNMFYGFMRGIGRIAEINKRHGHTDER